MIAQIKKLLLERDKLSIEEALEVANYYAASDDVQELFDFTNELRGTQHGKSLDLCSIVNAKSGKCSEDCKFCAQSSHHNTSVESYDLVDQSFAVNLAKGNEKQGVGRFSLVTAGRGVGLAQLKLYEPIYSQLKEETNLHLCASMGMLTNETATKLKEMGVSRYHCNLETAESFFKNVCTSHSWQDKIKTIRCAQGVGLEVCSGGIIGLGETRKQRLELATQLRELDVKSIPINILNPIKNTPFEDIAPLSIKEILVTFAMFVLINPSAVIRIAGGRNLLGKHQEKLFQIGVSGAIVGDYLTTSGDGLKNDIEMFQRIGLQIKRF